ncbi:DNA cytosine methyltransferase [Burkholderia gladioli]|uniref:DNA cytosine methyltransferase n=1 Tax=Burkholderia gladioli TaxID=28095 RepID=UPI00163F4917|nr:DNA cytosine methyltransferase [Burkholderia gladioli]
MKRDLMSLPLDLGSELIIDNFAGGGGTSTGLERAFGRPVDIAINHDPVALAMHALNHPHTKHLCESVWDVDPIAVTNNQPVGLVWLSPDCRHFSKAKGATPVSKNIRGLAWVTLRWLLKTFPRTFAIENVEEFVTWGDLLEIAPGVWIPDPSKKGDTFRAFIGMITTGVEPNSPALAEACEALGIAIDSPDALRLIAGLGYKADWRELRACDNGAPTIRKRLFIVGRRDGLPIMFPVASHGEPTSRDVLAGILAPYRTAAECIDFGIEARSIFHRKKPLVSNTERRVAKGLWRHVLASSKPFIIPAESAGAAGQLAPFVNEHTNASNQRTMRADEPLRTVCAQVKGGHFSIVAPTLVQMRGTSEGHLGARSAEEPLSTVSAGGTHHALTSAHLVTIGYGEREGQEARTHSIEQPLGTVVAGGVKQAVVATHITKFRTGSAGTSMLDPMPTVTANSFLKRPGGSAPLGMVAAHLMHVTHHGDRPGTTPDMPLPTITAAHRGEQAMAAAYFEQANGGFYDGDGRAADAPLSTVTSAGSNQRLVSAYLVKYYSSGGQWQDLDGPMHTVPTKGRMGLVQVAKVPIDSLAPEHREKARLCAKLLHTHLPEEFPELCEMVLMFHSGAWWVLVDITLRMLKPRELYRAQSFPESYIIHEIPDPALLFKDGVQVPGDPRLLPRIPLTATAQIRMCGNSVSPKQAEALISVNFTHERQFACFAA